jgi:hypothetical protein
MNIGSATVQQHRPVQTVQQRAVTTGLTTLYAAPNAMKSGLAPSCHGVRAAAPAAFEGLVPEGILQNPFTRVLTQKKQPWPPSSEVRKGIEDLENGNAPLFQNTPHIEPAKPVASVPHITRQALEAARDWPPSENRRHYDLDGIIKEGICARAVSNPNARDKAIGILQAVRSRNALDIFVNTRILSKVGPEIADILIELIPVLVEHEAQVAAQFSGLKLPEAAAAA